MRHSVDRILRPHEADDLAQEIGYLDFNDSSLQPILKAVSGFFPVSYEKPSYVRVEHKPEGHPWHTDQGNKGHMSWCKYSASVLLTRPVFDFSGGGFYFRDDPDRPIFAFCDLIVWDGDDENVHCCASHKGNRRVLIMFFGRDDGANTES